MPSSTSPKQQGAHSRGAHGGGSGGGDDHGGGGGGGGGGGRLVKVAFARNQAEAELIQGLLSEAGVPSVLKRSGGFDNPDFLAAGPHDIWVNAAHEEEAKRTLAETMVAEDEDEARAEVEAEMLGRPASGGPAPGKLAAWVLLATVGAIALIWILYELS
jgi:hypothetical protein